MSARPPPKTAKPWLSRNVSPSSRSWIEIYCLVNKSLRIISFISLSCFFFILMSEKSVKFLLTKVWKFRQGDHLTYDHLFSWTLRWSLGRGSTVLKPVSLYPIIKQRHLHFLTNLCHVCSIELVENRMTYIIAQQRACNAIITND